MIRKNPLKLLGTIFACIAVAEALVLLVLLCIPAIRAQSEALIVLPSVLGLQSLIFGGIGAGFLLHVSRQEKLRQDLLSNGLYETAIVVAIEQDWRVRVNGRSPYRVICRLEREGALHEYRSHLIYDLPALQTGDPIKVYLDWQDDKCFYVDVESASPAVIRHG